MLKTFALFVPLLFFFSFVNPTATASAEEKNFSSKDYQDVFQHAVEALVGNEPQNFKELLSPELIKRSEESLGEGAVDSMIKESFIPFFKEYSRLDPNVTETTTSDVSGHKGIAYFRVFLTMQGEQKPFAVYILNENGKLVVGNLVVNKTYREITDALKKASAASPRP